MIGYWIQNIAVLNVLRKSDARHATLMVVQLLFLLVYLYGVGLGVDLQMHTATLIILSSALMLMGVMALFAWRYATRNGRLVADGVSTEELEDLQVRMIPEPVTAALTLVAASFGAGAWEATWLLFPVLAWPLNRRKAKRRAQLQG